MIVAVLLVLGNPHLTGQPRCLIAEYIGTSVKMAMGRPLYLVTSGSCRLPARATTA